MRLYPGNGTGGFRSPVLIGTRWQSFPEVAGGSDVNNDGRADLLAWTSGGGLFLYPGNGSGGFAGSGRQIGSGWGAIDLRS